jgi:hypothetical protein
MNTTASRPPVRRVRASVLEAIAEQGAVGQPRQRVVQRLVRERVGGRLLGADVLDLRDEVQRLAVLPAHEPRRHRGPDRVPVGVQVALLAVPAVVAAVEHALEQRATVAQVLGRGDLRPSDAFQLLAGAAEHVAERGVDAREAAVGGGEAHADHGVVEARAVALLALARGLERLRLALAHALVEPPRQDRGEPGGGDERGVDAGPLPRMGDVVGVAEHQVAAADRAAEAVVQDDVERRQQERDPVLVERQHDDHHEEVEVRFDVAAGDVDDERRGGQQAGGDDRRAQLAPVGEALEDRGGRDRRRVERRVPDREALEQAEREQPGDVEPQQVDHPAMALLPALVGKGLALRQEVTNTPHDPPSADVLRELTLCQPACAGSGEGHRVVKDRNLVPARVVRSERLELGPVPVQRVLHRVLEGGDLLELVQVVLVAVDSPVAGAVAQGDGPDLVQRGLEGVTAEARRVPGDVEDDGH